MDTPEREFAAKMLAEGWDVTKRGWPDFLCRRNGELMAVEVKGPRDGLSRQQWETITDLRAAGIPTYVWGPSEGFTEVGPPVGESVFSLKQTIAQLRQVIADLQAGPKPIDQTVVEWTFVENDPASLEWVKTECLRTHSKHWHSCWVSGSLCYDVALLARRFSAEEIMRRTGLTSIGKTRKTLDAIRSKMFDYQHNALHDGLGVGRRCTSCPALDEVA